QTILINGVRVVASPAFERPADRRRCRGVGGAPARRIRTGRPRPARHSAAPDRNRLRAGRARARGRARPHRPRAGRGAPRRHHVRAAPLRGRADPGASPRQPGKRRRGRGGVVTADQSVHIQSPRIALLGNPNCGKTALFNLLTGSRQKVANYAGVTVERKEGHFSMADGRTVRLLDLPGAYSLNPISADEEITRDVVTGTRADEARPDLLVCVTDATNLKLNLRLVLEAKQLNLPMVLALNMSDAARRQGIQIDTDILARELGMPV